MKRIYLIAGLFLISGMPLPVAAADEHMVVVSPDGLKWGAAPPAFPKGAQLAVVSGDPSGADLHRLPPIPFLSSTTSRSGCRNYASNKPPGFAKP